MKKSIYISLVAFLAFIVVSCNRSAVTEPGSDSTKVKVPNKTITQGNLRIVTAAYSQPISIDTANRMIASYLESVNYPYQDTAVRSLAFDADTLRAYLADANITTLKFYLAHQQSYLNGDVNRFGKNIGMRPGALTVICVGVDDLGQVVKNSSNGVYEHAMPCPNLCGFEVDAYLH